MNVQNKKLSSQTNNEEFEKFVYLLSHDLRNSVRALIEVPLWIEEDILLRNIKIDGSLSENLSLMNTHTRRLDRMLIDLLTYSRVGRRQVTTFVELEDVIELVIDQIGLQPGFKISSNLRQTKFHMGERDVLTLFAELIGNATKHHDKGSGKITISSRKLKDSCEILVQDDGPGIQKKYRARVFEAMTTLKPRDEVEGSGMGLATVQKIVTFYGGNISFPDELNETGTTIKLLIPI